MVSAVPRNARFTNLYFVRQIKARLFMSLRYSAIIKSSSFSSKSCSALIPPPVHDPQKRYDFPPGAVRGKITIAVHATEKQALAAKIRDKAQDTFQDGGLVRNNNTLPCSFDTASRIVRNVQT